MAVLRQENASALAEHLFAPTERWGWQYLEPAPLRVSPELHSEPQWMEPPPPPGIWAMHQQAAQLKAKAVGRGLIVGTLLLFGFVLVYHGGGLLIILAVVLGAVWFSPLISAVRAASSMRKMHEQLRLDHWNGYNLAREQWSSRGQQWDDQERTRRDVADLWFPLELPSVPQRVDVFGGTPDGWAALLCTAGPTILQSGTSMLVVDFTEEDVTGPLCLVARRGGFPASQRRLPADLETAQLIEGLDAEAIAELIAESVDTMRRGGEDVEMRTLDVELVKAVVTRLDDDVTFRRIAAGLLTLQQGYDPDRDNRLTTQEFQRLAEMVDTVGATERTQNELQFLRAVLDMLPTPPAAEEHDPKGEATSDGIWPRSGVSVLRTEDDNRRRRDFVDRLLAQVLLQNVRQHRISNRTIDAILVLAGADHLGAQTLEVLARRCRQSDVRLVLLMEHLRGDLQDILGGSDSVTFFMRLGNPKEAAAAAEHIGRGHRFLLTQLTRQSGRTDSTGTSDSTGVTTSDTTGGNDSRGTSRTGWFGRPTISHQSGTNWSITTGESKQWSTNESRALSTTDGETDSRVYEFTVEPTTIQSLDLTSFVFVETANGQRRAFAGTCDPYISLMPRVAATAPSEPAVGPRPTSPRPPPQPAL